MKLGGRAWTWLLYGPSTLASVLFCIVSIVTFADLAQVQYDASAGSLGAQLNGAMAATFMGPVLTGGLLLLSFGVLIRKSFSRNGAGFSYGLCTGWFLLNSMFLLLTGVTLTATKHYTAAFEASAKGNWTRSSTNAYVGTEALAFICTGFHLAMAATLITNRKSFGGAQLTVDELGLSTRLRTPGSPSSTAGLVAGSPAPAFPEPDALPGTRQAGAWNAV